MSQSTDAAAARLVLIAKRDAENAAVGKDKTAITEAQARIESRGGRIQLLNEMIAELSPSSNGSEAPLKGFGKYSGMTTREGILDVLGQAGGAVMSGGQIAKRLLAEGAKSKSKNFSTIVFTESKRLVGLGKVTREAGGFRISEAAKRGVSNLFL